MTLEIILNELSLENPATDINTARGWISNFILTLKVVKKSSKSITLRTQYDFPSTQLAPDYPIRRWLNDREVDREERRFLRNLATKSPFSEDIVTTEIKEVEENTAISEFYHEGQLAIGLGIAYLLDALSISILSESKWNFSHLRLDVTAIDENEELVYEEIELRHISCSSHVKEHTDWIHNRIRIRINDGRELWRRRGELFPHLEFCEAVAPQLDALQPGNPMLKQVLKRLFELEESSKNWISGNFDLDSLPSKATPESDSRLNQFKRQLTILCLDGNERLFSLHLRMTPGAWRLYFSTEGGPQKIMIGYVGRKIQ